MFGILSKIVSAVFILLVYYFIFIIVKMIYSDINVMKRKKAGLPEYEAFIKPINQPHDLDFELKESYGLYGDDIIGRGRDVSIFIDDTFLSHRHSRIFKDKDGFFIEDMDSTNGTFLNGREVEDEAVELLDGDRICVGQVEFVFMKPEAKL